MKRPLKELPSLTDLVRKELATGQHLSTHELFARIDSADVVEAVSKVIYQLRKQGDVCGSDAPSPHHQDARSRPRWRLVEASVSPEPGPEPAEAEADVEPAGNPEPLVELLEPIAPPEDPILDLLDDNLKGAERALDRYLGLLDDEVLHLLRDAAEAAQMARQAYLSQERRV